MHSMPTSWPQGSMRDMPQVVDALGSGLSPGARRALTVWLGGCAGWVFSMVVLGGMTRLTRSGLSMTDWKFTGERAPRTQVTLICSHSWNPCISMCTGHCTLAHSTCFSGPEGIAYCLQEDWEAEYAKYRASPEYQKVNRCGPCPTARTEALDLS